MEIWIWVAVVAYLAVGLIILWMLMGVMSQMSTPRPPCRVTAFVTMLWPIIVIVTLLNLWGGYIDWALGAKD